MTQNDDLNDSPYVQYPLVSIVIPNYNGLQYLKRCFKSIQNQSYPHIETIFVDNGSVDRSCEYVAEEFPGVIVIKNPINLGFSGGINTGIRASKGKYIFTLNTDTEFDPECLSHLVHEMEEFLDVGLCGPKLLFFSGGINSTGMFFSLGGCAWDRGMGEEDVGQYDGPACREVMGICAGAALYRKTMLDEIGYFDEDFFLIFEDYDLSLRAYMTGWKARYVYEAVVYHIRGGTMEPTSDMSVFYGERNVFWVPVKNYPIFLLVKAAPFIFLHNCLSLLFWIKKGKGKPAVLGKIAAIKNIELIMRKRNQIKGIRNQLIINIPTLCKLKRVHE